VVKKTVLDKRQILINPGNKQETINFCIEHFISCAKKAIDEKDAFYVALSGGSTPKVIFEGLKQRKDSLDWSKVYLFWSDERAVSPDHPDSNYKMEMDAGFSEIKVPKDQIFRMRAEDHIEQNAEHYESLIKKIVPNTQFDLIMLGMGDDGHTASLFPKTHGLHTKNRLVIANFIPKFDAWRMSFTYDCINQAKNIAIYVIGKKKADILKTVLKTSYEPDTYPIQKVGTDENPCTFICDDEASFYMNP
jgi:6-phosphogluconolactonase